MKRYEGMFLFDSAAVHDWAAMEKEIRRLLERIGGNLLVCVKFDERKLAFEIKRRKRGTYVLCYFEAPAEKITDLERDAHLSELLLRHIVLRTEITEEKLAELRKHPVETPLSPAGSDRRHDDDRGGDRYDRGGGDRYDRGGGDRFDRGGGRRRERSEEEGAEEMAAPATTE